MGGEKGSLKWVRLKHYCALSGDSPHALHPDAVAGNGWMRSNAVLPLMVIYG